VRGAAAEGVAEAAGATEAVTTRAGKSAGKGGGGKKGGFVPKGNARYDRHDHYYREAKKEGFVARSIYKLDEIDAKFRLIKKGDAVLDLGCAPGSWLQYATERVGERGAVVGIDLLPSKVNLPANVRVMEGDAFETPIAQLQVTPGRLFDVVLSDMAPNTTGIRTVDQSRSLALCERALEVAQAALRAGGAFVAKIFEGQDQRAYLDAVKKVFQDVDVYRPKSTRQGSIEVYVVGRNKRRLA
jgi:23S rRNA (uridine2552-2'-O)-methyltransferase